MTSPKIEIRRPQVDTPHPRAGKRKEPRRDLREAQLNGRLFSLGRYPFSPGIISPRDRMPISERSSSLGMLAMLMPPPRLPAASASPEPFSDVTAPSNPVSSQSDNKIENFGREYRRKYKRLEIPVNLKREIITPVSQPLPHDSDESLSEQETGLLKTNGIWECKACNRVFSIEINAYAHFFCPPPTNGVKI